MICTRMCLCVYVSRLETKVSVVAVAVDVEIALADVALSCAYETSVVAEVHMMDVAVVAVVGVVLLAVWVFVCVVADVYDVASAV